MHQTNIYRNNDVWNIPLPCKDFQTRYGLLIANNITKLDWSVFLNPGSGRCF